MRRFAAACAFALGATISQGQETAAVELNSVRLYLPDDALRQRLGDDVDPLAEYIKALESETDKFWRNAERPRARGLLVAVGVKPGKKVKVWCEAVEGQIPAQTLSILEQKLRDLPTIAVHQGPVAFAMELKLWGQSPGTFQEMPRTWLEAAKKSKTAVVVPDGMFKLVWPE